VKPKKSAIEIQLEQEQRELEMQAEELKEGIELQKKRSSYIEEDNNPG